MIKLFKKSPITLAIVFVVFNFLIFQIPLIYSCIINLSQCTDDFGMGGYILYFPTSYLIGKLFSLIETIIGQQIFIGQDEYWIILAGTIHSFILGYLLGLLIKSNNKIKK